MVGALRDEMELAVLSRQQAISQMARKTTLPWKVTGIHEQELCFNGFWVLHWLSAEGE